MTYIRLGSGSSQYIELSSRFLFRDDVLMPEALSTVPIPGYYDIICHSDGRRLFYYDRYANEVEVPFDLLQYTLHNKGDYMGGPIRLIACYAGAFEKWGQINLLIILELMCWPLQWQHFCSVMVGYWWFQKSEIWKTIFSPMHLYRLASGYYLKHREFIMSEYVAKYREQHVFSSFEDVPSIKQLTREKMSSETKTKVMNYLLAVEHYRAHSMCGKVFNGFTGLEMPEGASVFSDGDYTWHGDLPLYVRDCDIELPSVFIERVLLATNEHGDYKPLFDWRRHRHPETTFGELWRQETAG